MPTEGQTGTAPDGTKVIFRNGRIEPLNGPKSRPEWGAGAVELPDGSIARTGPRGGFTVLQGPTKPSDAPPDIKEFQASAAARATLMDQGLTDYNQAVSDGYDPSSVGNQIARTAEGVWGVGPWLSDVIRDNPAERARAAELQFVDGALRTTSGANAPEPEVIRANRAYFRQPGESQGVEPNKSELRQRFRDQAVRTAGPAYMQPQGGNRPVVIQSPQEINSLPVGALYRYPNSPPGTVHRKEQGARARTAQDAPTAPRITKPVAQASNEDLWSIVGGR